MLSPPNSSAGFLGDYIGTESCLDLKKSINEELSFCSTQARCKRTPRLPVKEREFPPPIPLLARTENQASHSRMPWILKRHHTNDGRLILIEEKVKHHEYFKAQRYNGHLTMQLVHVDDKFLVPPFLQNLEEDDDDDNETGVEEEEEEEEGFELELEEKATVK